jgi:hypothetical protein
MNGFFRMKDTMTDNPAASAARKLMEAFARNTGLMDQTAPPRRYLWTDAFAVCNFLALYNRHHDKKYLDLARRLVDQVHHVLGRNRADDPRSGWISGLSDAEGERHPTIGGLRIGKKLPEQGPMETSDDRSEWDRDGQYYHYLTRWMHALDQFSRVTGDPAGNQWAREMAWAVHKHFTYSLAGGRVKRMYWKMSIDLSRPLVSHMGHHDPLDGLITYQQLRATSIGSIDPDLDAEIAELAAICQGKDWATDDPLGLGGLMADACRLAQFSALGHPDETDLLENLLDASRRGLNVWAARHNLKHPAEYRLAFRELGLSIGLKAVSRIKALVERRNNGLSRNNRLTALIGSLAGCTDLIREIESFWQRPEHRRADSWTAHQDINDVMLAASLAPEGYLELRSPEQQRHFDRDRNPLSRLSA